MIDLKRTKKQQAKKKDISSDEYFEEYPYGARLQFDSPEIDKIDSLKNIKAGDSVEIKAVGMVTEVRIIEVSKGSSERTVEVQIQKISIDSKAEEAKGFNEKEDDD